MLCRHTHTHIQYSYLPSPSSLCVIECLNSLGLTFSSASSAPLHSSFRLNKCDLAGNSSGSRCCLSHSLPYPSVTLAPPPHTHTLPPPTPKPLRWPLPQHPPKLSVSSRQWVQKHLASVSFSRSSFISFHTMKVKRCSSSDFLKEVVAAHCCSTKQVEESAPQWNRVYQDKRNTVRLGHFSHLSTFH